MALGAARECRLVLCFFFNDTATTEIYTLSLHDALPISGPSAMLSLTTLIGTVRELTPGRKTRVPGDRKSTRLNSSHLVISYAVFCLKKKKKHFHLVVMKGKNIKNVRS